MLGISCSFSGCLFHHTTNFLPDLPVEKLIDEGKVLDLQALKKGGNLLIIPFKAGVDAESNDDLHKISLMIVRGVSDAIQRENAPFHILGADNADLANLVMKGFITHLSSSGRIKRWVLRKNEIFINVEGKIVNPESGEVIIVFSHHGKANLKTDQEQDLARKIGEDLGLYLVRQLKN